MITKEIHRGQVALIMVLIMTVVSAVVVSVASRTTSELRNQRLSKDSADAFLTAQSGLEDALSKRAGVSGTDNDKSYTVTLEDLGQQGLLTEKISSGTSFDVVLNASPLLQGVKVFWKSANSSPSAILVSKINTSTFSEEGFDSLGVNGFTKVTTGGVLSGSNFSYVTPTISVDTNVLKIRITVLGESSFVGIQPIGDTLPVQAFSYKAESSVGAGDEKVKYGLYYEETKNSKTPEVFDYAVFSYGTIIQ